jgi:hypothetical protein
LILRQRGFWEMNHQPCAARDAGSSHGCDGRRIQPILTWVGIKKGIKPAPLGFKAFPPEERGSFTYIEARKTRRGPVEGAVVRFWEKGEG